MTPETVYVGVSRWLAAQRRRKRRRLRQDTVEAIESVARAAGGSGSGGDDGGGNDSPDGAGSDPGAFTTYGAPYTGGEGGGGGGDPGPDGEGGGGGGDDGGGVTVTPVLLVDYVTDPDLEDVPFIDALIDPGFAVAAALAGFPFASVTHPTPIGRGPSPWSDHFTDGAVASVYSFLGTWSESVVAGEFGPTTAGAGSAGNWNSAAIYNVEPFDDVTVSAKLANGINSGWSLLLCVDDPVNPQNGYAAKFRTTNITFAKIVAGVAVNLGTAADDPTAADVLSVTKTGADFSLKINGVEVLAVTDSTFASGYVGMAVGSTNTTTRFDDVTITPL